MGKSLSVRRDMNMNTHRGGGGYGEKFVRPQRYENEQTQGDMGKSLSVRSDMKMNTDRGIWGKVCPSARNFFLRNKILRNEKFFWYSTYRKRYENEQCLSVRNKNFLRTEETDNICYA
jgi:hypothetical protein